MQINITRFFNEAPVFDFSHSQMEGGPNAGPETWNNAKDAAAESPLLTTPEQLDALREYVKGFGAWDDEEIAAWSDNEVNALFIQLLSGDMREAGLDNEPDEDAWKEYESRAEAGQCQSNIYKGDDGEIYYSLDR
jgi:hypothetical protein